MRRRSLHRRDGGRGPQLGETIGPCRAITTTAAQVICPSGGLLTGVSSPPCKNISVSGPPKSHLELWPSHPTRGAYHDRHGRGVGCGGRGSVLRAMGSQGGSKGP